MMDRLHVFALFASFGLVACNFADEDGTDGPLLDDDESDAPQTADDIVSDSNPQAVEPMCHNAAGCCPAGTVAVFGTAAPDVMSTSLLGRCQLSLGGADAVADLSASGLHAVLAGPGNDQVKGGYGKAILAGGADADTLQGRASADELYGQPGNDTLHGGPGNDRVSGGLDNDILVGGPGADSVDGGSGNDHVYIHDLCELASGEMLNGGAGVDTLHAPVAASSLGVPVAGFENFVVEASPAQSTCAACGCEYVAGEGIVCCNGRGTCDVAEEEGMVCDCDPGYAGKDCGYDVAATFYDDLPPACEEPGMACSSLYPVDDAVLSQFDLLASDECDDLTLLAIHPFVDLFVTYPAAGPDEWAAGEFPFVLLGAGNGFDESQYQPLAAHLAAQGFVVVAASPSPVDPEDVLDEGNQGGVGLRGEELHCLRRLLPDLEIPAGDPPLGDHHDGRLAYLGHSRGGEAAVIATSLDAETLVPAPEAVISLAPTNFCSRDNPGTFCGYDDNVANDRGSLADGRTPAFLVMQGSQDADPYGQGVWLHDVATKEHADDVLGGLVTPPTDAMVKAMKWVFSAGHGGWVGGVSNGGLLAETFGLAFLQWHVLGDTSLRGLFTGTATDPCVADPSSCSITLPPPTISSQYREPGPDLGGRRIVVRYFSEAFTNPEGTGGPVTKSGAVTQVEANDPGPRAHLRGLAVHLAAEAQKTAWLELGLDRSLPGAVLPLDAIAAGVSHLSLRLVRVVPADVTTSPDQAECEAAAAANTTPLSVRVTLEDADGVTAVVRTSDVTPVLPPHIVWTSHSLAQTCEAINFWTTVRIPLSEFMGVDRRALSSVRITLDTKDNGFAPMEALLDTVELVGHELDGVCGDGVVTGEEECDGTDLDGRSCYSYDMVGTLACTSSCTFDLSGCLDCEPGETGCTCLDEAVDGPPPQGPLPGGGSLGDGHYCADDVVFGGTHRCVEDGQSFVCDACLIEPGDAFCPCVPGDGCANGSMECHFACDSSPCTEESVALEHGYCFLPGEDPEDGGVPSWFFDAYCDVYMDDFVCNYVDGGGNVCVDGPGDGSSCQL